MTSEEHHRAFIASKATQLHAIAREQWQSGHPGVITIDCENGTHGICYITNDIHRTNIAEGVYSGAEGELIGDMLRRCQDPEHGFPTVMYHDDDDGTITAMITHPAAATQTILGRRP